MRENGVEELFPQSSWNVETAKTFCNDSSSFQFLCVTVIFLIFGTNVQQMNSVSFMCIFNSIHIFLVLIVSLLPKVISHNPGASVQSVLHFRQNYMKKGKI